ncbi:MAG TPA: Gfo/Idh/MocA family oxidoreductase [Chloroflexota bacterium]|nr:Gfo/Idh/MocA family oxidoreductase [Chloroflexota bacterium]
MTRTVRVGIIGSGSIAGAHARAYAEMPDVEVVAVADVVPGRAADFITRHSLTGATPFEDHRRLLEADVEAVSVCTPNVAHHRTAVDSLEAGKHVLVEKPLAVTLEQAVEMARAARRTGRLLSVGFQPRYDPNMQLVKGIVRSGQLGKIYYVETGGGRRRGMPVGTFIRKDLAGAGALADIGCYSLDMALDALDYPLPLTVSATASSHFGSSPRYHKEAERFEVEDFGVALVRLEGGITLTFKTAWAMHMDTLGATLFLGTDAGLKVTPAGSGPWSGVWDGGVGSVTLYHDILGYHTESPIPVRSHNVRIFYEKVRDFVTAVQEGRPAPIPAEQIVRNQAVIDAVLRSAAEQREVAVEIPPL